LVILVDVSIFGLIPIFLKVLVSSSELPTACSIIMPRHKKASVRAKTKRQSGQSIFTHVEEDISEHRSVYNDSGEEEIWSDEDELDAAHTEDSLESIASLQRLYAVFLPPHLKQQNLVSSCLCPYISIYLPVNSQAKKAKISN